MKVKEIIIKENISKKVRKEKVNYTANMMRRVKKQQVTHTLMDLGIFIVQLKKMEVILKKKNSLYYQEQLVIST